MQTRLLSRFLILALGLMTGATLCLAQQGMPPREGLALFNNALQAAGAPALTSEQEASIKALIAEFRESHQKPAQDTAIQGVRTAFENAVLNGDLATATDKAEALGEAQAKEMVRREIDTAAFAISVIDVLKTGSGQVSAMVAQMDAGRFVRLVLNLAGGSGGFGPRGGGPGLRGGPGPRGPFARE
jgi:hypothetical protein